MKMKIVSRLALAVTLVGLSFTQAQAGGPVIGIEDIEGVVGPNESIDMWFPNIFDLRHPKLLHFKAEASNDHNNPAKVGVKFDWLGVDGQVNFSPLFELEIPGAGGIIEARYMIDFCPERVSLHVRTPDGQDTIHKIRGRFVHECMVPEPSSALVAGLGALGGLGFLRRRAS